MPRPKRDITTSTTVYAARMLRKNMTRSEKNLWDALRKRQSSGLRFRRQYPIGPYVLDFFCLEKRLAVEVDGGIHDKPEQRLADAERTRYLEDNGIRVVRIRNEELVDIQNVLDKIVAFI